MERRPSAAAVIAVETMYLVGAALSRESHRDPVDGRRIPKRVDRDPVFVCRIGCIGAEKLLGRQERLALIARFAEVQLVIGRGLVEGV